jgi:hypothetical protein
LRGLQTITAWNHEKTPEFSPRNPGEIPGNTGNIGNTGNPGNSGNSGSSNKFQKTPGDEPPQLLHSSRDIDYALRVTLHVANNIRVFTIYINLNPCLQVTNYSTVSP